MFPGQDRLYAIWPELPNGNRVEISYPEFLDWQSELKGFSALAVMWSSTLKRVVRSDGELHVVPFRWVSASFFETLAVAPHLGRTFEAADTEPGTACVAVVSYGFWQTRFGGSADVLGQVLEGEEPCIVIGVMTGGFAYPKNVDLWLALRREGYAMNREAGVLWGVGRIAEDVDSAGAQAELDALNRRLDEEHFGFALDVTMKMRPIVEEHLGGGTRPGLVSLLVSVGLLFLIACANVAGISVTRALARSDELWIQRALGASPAVLIGELMTESAIIAGAGCILGLVAAASLLKLLLWLAPPHLPGLENVELDGAALSFAVVAAFTATLLSGLSAAGTWRRSHRGRVRDGLVVAEVALAMVLLTGAGLCFRSFNELRRIELGFETERILSAIFIYPDASYPELADRRRLVRAVLDRVQSVPGVTSAASVLLRPFEGESVGWSSYLLLEGQPIEGPSFTGNPEVNFEAVTPGYFRTMGIRLLEGRDFTEQDTDESPRVVIITRELSERLWPGEPAIGKRLLASFGSKVFDENQQPLFQTVVGVVEKANYRGLLSHYFDLYAPYGQSNPQPNNLMVRTAEEPEGLASRLREAVREVDPGIAVTGMTTLEAMVEREFRSWRFNVQLFSFLGVTASLLAAIGLGGLLAIGVRERTREIAIRASIGATPASLRRAFLRKGISLAGIGTLFGLLMSLLIGGSIRSLLYGVEPWDIATLGGVTVTLLATSFVASGLAAGRASRISPSAALRHQ